jgi:hypothetical protein
LAKSIKEKKDKRRNEETRILNKKPEMMKDEKIDNRQTKTTNDKP